MRVLFLAAEATPFVKVGGLGDVAGALPDALRAAGQDVRLVLPRYGSIEPSAWKLQKLRDNFPVAMDWRQEACQIWATADEQTWFIENQYFFGSRNSIYGHGDDAERFILFCRAALEACHQLNWWPDIVHAHDWHSAAAIRLLWPQNPRPALIFTIHNIAHQGLFSAKQWPLIGVYDAEEPLNLMAQAIYSADVITTVSPTYAQEIQRHEYGFGLDGILRERQNRLTGIINGLDMNKFNPAHDSQIAQTYTWETWQVGKAMCKAALQRQFGLHEQPDTPLIGVVSRLDDQKGIDLIVQSIDTLMAHSSAQLMVLGSGHPPYEDAFRYATARYPGRIGNYIGFNAGIAQQVYAASDMFLMPSSFEPCGLSQMIAMRYGAVPIVRATGGLVDTVPDMSQSDGIGIVWSDYDAGAMLQAIGRGLAAYSHPEDWQYFVKRAMQQDWNWSRSAERYIDVYRWSLTLR